MSQRLRFLLDTNVLIPLQDSQQILEPSLQVFLRLAQTGGHQLMCHPANLADFQRDPNEERRQRNLDRVKIYPALSDLAPCDWNDANTSPNDACDNELLFAIRCDAVHALVTEDKGIHAKARAQGLASRVYTIQMAEEWLRRLHETSQVVLPNIQNVPLHSLTPELPQPFFQSLREGYPPAEGRKDFDTWFRGKAQSGGKAWVYRTEAGELAAICVYDIQTNERVNDDGRVLPARALKLCTFKVGDLFRGRKIGELFLKAAFRFATDNRCEHIFITAKASDQSFLIYLLEDFGFEPMGSYNGDLVMVKAHPLTPPPHEGVLPMEYVRRFFPHHRSDAAVQKFLVPIQPGFHEMLFPDYAGRQAGLFGGRGDVGNAIKLAYLCHAQTNHIKPGDVLLFYRSKDEMAVTSVGVVDQFEVSNDSSKIASLVSRRTVYSIDEIDEMAARPTKVILFRLIGHLSNSVPYVDLLRLGVVSGNIQSMRKINDAAYSNVLAAARR
ncbi:MAG: N-acetyltransferase [Pseudomonadota bacterium]